MNLTYRTSITLHCSCGKVATHITKSAPVLMDDGMMFVGFIYGCDEHPDGIDIDLEKLYLLKDQRQS